jgi:DNA-binding SARP family transcriptional activator
VESASGAAPTRPIPATDQLELSVLGPVEVRRAGKAVDLGTPKQRAVVAALALSGGRPVPLDSLIDLLWRDAAPAAAITTLQAYVSGLRKSLEPGRRSRDDATVLVTVPSGYSLRVHDSDAARFVQTVTEEHARLAAPLLGASPLSVEELRASVRRLDDVLATWRGRPYTELEDAPEAAAERVRLEELRAVALEDKAVARLALGEHAAAAAELEALTSAYPLRERLWALRALALVRSGRQADALQALREVRQLLDTELGLDPSVELRHLQDGILQQDHSLDWVPPTASSQSPGQDAPPSGPAHTVTRSDLSAPTTPATLADWPMLGRESEVTLLETALSKAGSGRTARALVTGEPGIGKSRLCAELAALARRRGFSVVVGSCSQDDGAPPLWPWTTVLDSLGIPLPSADGDDLGAEFRVREAIVRSVRQAAAARPLLLVLDDLHWADTPTLRVLRLLAETSASDHLMLVGTWRDQPRPTGALADVAETLARLHAVRVELTGLNREAVTAVVDAVTASRPSTEEADALRRRTDGNPFFLIEYARLAGDRAHLAELLAEDDPPTAVHDVICRRLERLPDETVETLHAASVIGRDVDLGLLAAATGTDEDRLLDLLEPARDAGLVREDGVDRFVFAHALVRDTIYGDLSPSRRARRHARVAAHLTGLPARETEAAHHWLSAGPAHAGRAWRAAAAAARVARQAHAYLEAVALSRAALDTVDRDAAATLRDRYDLLMDLVTAYRWAAMWPDLIATVERAVDVADQLGDPVLAAEAVIMTTQGALWQSAAHGEVHHGVVAALRRSLRALPEGDSALRCRCMLSLANELYYATTPEERRALVDEALAMARRLADPVLLVHACQVAFVSIWAPSTAVERLELATEAVELARSLDDRPAEVLALCLRAVALGELGRPAEMWQVAAEARAMAEPLRLVYVLLVLDSMAIAWHALAGEFELCQQLLEEVLALVSSSSLKHSDDAVAGAVVTMAMWQGRTAEAAAGVAAVVDGPLPVDALLVHMLWRDGQEDEARAHYASHRIVLDDDDWFSMLNWCNAGAAALYVGDAELGARAYSLLASLTGRSCSAGSGNASGPVDGWLAMAAAAAGDLDLATRHADDAERLAEEWRIPLFTQWLREQRDRYHF